ncbi:MAG: hypothetical protein DRP67_00490 [Candidatus Omnitrophota bacterium]|nr:MAG: hypothetical protein DRP67_00490 [Candidatus Omnitrophota bacterium]
MERLRYKFIIVILSIFLISPIYSKEKPFYLLSKTEQEKLLEKLINTMKKKKHPYLLFNKIEETAGWKNRDKEPWKTYFIQIKEAADRNVGIPYTWKGPRTGAIAHTDDIYANPVNAGFMYQVTKDKKYLKKAADLLKKATGLPPYTRWSKRHHGRVIGREMIKYAVGYDLIKEGLSPEEDKAIRDNLAKIADKACLSYSKWNNNHDRLILACGLGAMACALADYEGNTTTKPIDWLRRGTVNLFLKDDYKWPDGLRLKGEREIVRPALSGAVRPGGSIHGYFSYWSGPFTKWLIIYSHATGRNALEDFPIARGIVNVILTEALPTRTGSHHCTNLQSYWWHYHVLFHLVSPEERGLFKWYEKDPGVDKLRWRRTWGCVWGGVFSFCFYNPGLPSAEPNWKTFYSPKAELCVFRKDWSLDSDWLLFNCENYPSDSHRWMLHNDNMSFEYYSRGDYLLADNGEVKGRMYGYGPTYASGHNTLLIDGKGVMKENISKKAFKFINPARFIDHCVGPYLEFIRAKINVTHVEKNPLKGVYAERLDFPVEWIRTILYPGRDYFVVIDTAKSDGKHSYQTLYHLTSFNIIKTKSRNDPGKVIGKLFVGKSKVNWDKDVKTDILTGKNPIRIIKEYKGVSSVRWYTDNVLKKKVELSLITIPEPEKVIVGRTWGHIAMFEPPFSGSSEVDHPFVSFYSTGKDITRMTLILTRYTDEEKYTVKKINSAEGYGFLVSRGGKMDIIFKGNGKLENGKVEIEGKITYLRIEDGKVKQGILIDGRKITYKGEEIVNIEKPIPHLAFNINPEEIYIHLNTGDSLPNIRLNCGISVNKGFIQEEREDWKWGGKPHPLFKEEKPFGGVSKEGKFISFKLENKGIYALKLKGGGK